MATTLTIGAIHLHATTPPATPFSGSGTPWTVQSTTPFELAMNDKTGPLWTPQIAEAKSIYGGGPPFRNGSGLFYLNYDNVVETIPIQIRATSHDNAVGALRILRQELKKAQWTTPPVLALQPNNSAQAVNFEVYDGEVKETASFLNEEAGRGVLRAQMTITRSFAGGRLSTGETVLNNVTMQNQGTGSPNNLTAFSTGSGDMIYEGQPLNLTIGTSNATELILASALNRLYLPLTGSGTVTTGGGMAGLPVTFSVASAISQPRVRGRVLPRLASVGSCEMRFTATASLGGVYYTSPWVAVANGVADLGDIPLATFRNRNNSAGPALSIQLEIRATTGIQSYALADLDLLLYYTYCRLAFGATPIGSETYVTTFTEVAGRACLPVPQVVDTRNAAAFGGFGIVKGTAPRYYSGASLYLARAGQATTTTTTVTATHGALWRSLRGSV